MATTRQTIHRAIKGTEQEVGYQVDIPIPYVYNILRSNRARIIERDRRANAVEISQYLLQTIPCVELEKAPIHECPCIPPLGCEVYRSVHKLPKPISGMGGDHITSVMTLDGNSGITKTTWEAARYQLANKYTAHLPRYYIRNNRLYLTINPLEVEVVAVTGLFEDPLAAYDFPSICDESENQECLNPLDEEFPAEERLLDAIVSSAISEMTGLAPRYPLGRRRVVNETDKNEGLARL
jgi:hypothetical protein